MVVSRVELRNRCSEKANAGSLHAGGTKVRVLSHADKEGVRGHDKSVDGRRGKR